jgi:predicted ribosomally synthesized peptide with nif11-like leader
MSKSAMERFADAVRGDKGLQEEVKKAATSNEALVEFAKNKGYNVDLKEMVAYIESKKAALSMTDLDKVAGGGKTNVQTNVEVQAEVTVQAVQTQTAATTTTAAAEAECVIVAT